MPLDLLSICIGFVLGVVATAIAWNLTQRTVRNPETAKVTAVWSLDNVAGPGAKPALVAESIEGLALPAGSKVIVPEGRLKSVSAEILRTCEVRTHPDVRMNAAIGKDKALMFSGHVTPKAHAVYTHEINTVRRLQNDFSRMWAESKAYVDSVDNVSDLAGKDGRVVNVSGKALEVMEYRGRRMLRITDGKAAVGVVTKQDDVGQYTGGIVQVVGRMHREAGYAYIEADTVTLTQPAAQAVA